MEILHNLGNNGYGYGYTRIAWVHHAYHAYPCVICICNIPSKHTELKL